MSYKDGLSNAPSESTFSPAFAEINDTTSSLTYSYFCEASAGSLSSDAVWRISRLTNATGVVQWADGNGLFDNVADNRTSLSYS